MRGGEFRVLLLCHFGCSWWWAHFHVPIGIRFLCPFFFFFFGQNLFLWNFISSLCILDINPLLVLLFANVFSYSVQCLFILLLGSFAMQKLFGLMFISAFVAFTFGVNAKKSSSRPVLRNLLYFNITILGAMFKFLRYVIIVCNE